MKTGIELIAEEREKQIKKHGFTGEHHAQHPEWYEDRQLVHAARQLSTEQPGKVSWWPKNWDRFWFNKLTGMPYYERLKIVGALIAAELDRINALEELKSQDK